MPVAIDASTEISQQRLLDVGANTVVLGRRRRTGSQNMLDFGTVPHTCCFGQGEGGGGISIERKAVGGWEVQEWGSLRLHSGRGISIERKVAGGWEVQEW